MDKEIVLLGSCDTASIVPEHLKTDREVKVISASDSRLSSDNGTLYFAFFCGRLDVHANDEYGCNIGRGSSASFSEVFILVNIESPGFIKIQ